MCNYYLQQGFQVVFIKGDGEFAPLQAWMDTVYGAPQLNLASAKKHVPDIERKIRVIKERVRAVIYSIPFNALPAWMLTHVVLFVVKQLNLFPVKGGLSSRLSPKQILSGEVIDYKFCSMGFGRYCQIHEEDQPRNSMAARAQGAMSLGPSGNSQGVQKFYTLTTGNVVVRRVWTELPTPTSVITRRHLLAKGMPALPVFTDCTGRIIGDVLNKDIYDNNKVPALGDLPGVHTDETDGVDEIPGVDPVQEQDPTPAEIDDIDLDFAPAKEGNVEPPLVDTPPLVDDAPVVEQVPADDGIRRSQRVRTQPKPFVYPSDDWEEVLLCYHYTWC